MNPYIEYYVNQAGRGVGPVYVGAVNQRGHGIGSFLSGLFRSVFPLFKSGAKAIGQEALGTGFNVLRDAINQKPIVESIKSRIKEASDHLIDKADKKITELRGSGYKRKRTRPLLSHRGKQVKRLKQDIFS
jgi:hypothetical protein